MASFSAAAATLLSLRSALETSGDLVELSFNTPAIWAANSFRSRSLTASREVAFRRRLADAGGGGR